MRLKGHGFQISFRVEGLGASAYSDRGTTGSPETTGSPSIFVPVQYKN
jgi:hypothetical protein